MLFGQLQYFFIKQTYEGELSNIEGFSALPIDLHRGNVGGEKISHIRIIRKDSHLLK